MSAGTLNDTLWQKVRKYKLLHIIAWATIIAQQIYRYYDYNISAFATIFDNVFLVAIAIPPFYYTAYTVVPRYLYQNRYGLFLTILFGQALLLTVLYLIVGYASDYIYYPQVFAGPQLLPYGFWRRFLIIFWTYLLPMACASSFKVMSDRFRSETRFQQIQKERLSTELNFLRNQFHPHFLFNVLNAIYFRISRENTEARKIVELTSDMMRYQLYDVNDNMVEMNRELEFLEKYIKVSEYKGIEPDRIILYINAEVRNYKVAPLLFGPLLDIAFKNIDLKNQRMILKLTTNDNKIIFEIKTEEDFLPHDFETFVNDDAELDNLRRRLDILYPARYYFEYFRDKNQFYTKLTLLNGTY